MHNETELMREFDNYLNEDHDPDDGEFLSEILKKNGRYRAEFLNWCGINGYDF